MSMPRTSVFSIFCCMVVAASAPSWSAAQAAEPATRVLLVVGPSTHPPGTHEVAASARLVKYALEHAEGVPSVQADIVSAWPASHAELEDVATFVFFGDIFPGETLPDSKRVMTDLATHMGQGRGLLCVHYATGLRAQHVAADGDHPLLRWMGGYFATACNHHRSVAKVVTATITPGPRAHPVLRGWQAFTIRDEPYWNNYFGPTGPAPNVTALATAMLPPENPVPQTVAWAVERPDGGRGVGIVMPHFFASWKNDELRKLVLNGVCWTAGREVPAEGVQTKLPDLLEFQPGAVEPQARPKPAAPPNR